MLQPSVLARSRPVDPGLEFIVQFNLDHGGLDQHLPASAADYRINKSLNTFMPRGAGKYRNCSRFTIGNYLAIDPIDLGQGFDIGFQRLPEIVT